MRTHSRDWWAFPRLHAVRTVPRAAVPGVSSDLPARTPVYRGMDDAAKTAARGFHFDSNKHVRRAAGQTAIENSGTPWHVTVPPHPLFDVDRLTELLDSTLLNFTGRGDA